MFFKKKNNLLKRVITATEALVMSAGIAAPAVQAAVTYTDVSTNDWYYSYVDKASTKQIVNGYEDNTFRPDNTVSLGECIKMIMRYKDIECELGANHWADNYVQKAYELGLLSQGEYNDNDTLLSRQQVAKLVMLALNEAEVEFDTSIIPDFGLIPNSYQPYVKQAYAKGIITGYEDGSFIGDKAISRAELLAVLMRAFDPSCRVQVSTDKKQQTAYVRQDIDIRVNGLHCTLKSDGVNAHVVQIGDQIYVPDNYFYWNYDKTKPDKYGASEVIFEGLVPDYSSFSFDRYYFQNAWQPSNNVYADTTVTMEGGVVTSARGTAAIIGEGACAMLDNDWHGVSYYSISKLQSLGAPVEYDPNERIVYIGNKTPVVYAHKEATGKYGRRTAELKDTPIVSYAQDPNNCWAGLGVCNKEEQRLWTPDSDAIAFSASNERFLETNGKYLQAILNVSGCLTVWINWDDLDPISKNCHCAVIDALTGEVVIEQDGLHNSFEISAKEHPYLIVSQDQHGARSNEGSITAIICNIY